VVLESTTYPGTTDEDLREALKNGLTIIDKVGNASRFPFSNRAEEVVFINAISWCRDYVLKEASGKLYADCGDGRID